MAAVIVCGTGGILRFALPSFVQTAKSQTAPRGPTLEATNRSTIDATGANIPGDLPFQVGKADNDSLIFMPGADFRRNPDGSITISPGSKPVAFMFPPPVGKYATLTVPQLKQRLSSAAADLRELDRDLMQGYRDASKDSNRTAEISQKYSSIYREKFADLVFDLAGAAVSKIGTFSNDNMPRDASRGEISVYYKKFGGADAAAFLDFLSNKLPPS